MSHQPHVAVANLAEWRDLVAELDHWGADGRIARLWWRDDDAVAWTPQLDRLLTLAGDAPLALAVIPADAAQGLASALDHFPQVAVLHHGWCHANRAADYPGADYPGAGKKSEYPAERHPVDVADELEEGRQRLVSLFGRRALPVFVPPWNRFADRFVPLLAEAGLRGLSRMAPQRGPAPVAVAEIDVHIDVVDWRGTGGFAGAGAVLGRLVAELRARRRGAVDPPGAVGILTHHLVMDDPTAAFMAELAALVDSHDAARWTGAPELLDRA